MTILMTIFGIIAGGELGMNGVKSFFRYLPYHFTIALPIQMLIVAPLSLWIARKIANPPERIENSLQAIALWIEKRGLA